MNYERILDRRGKKQLVKWDLAKFKKSHPTFLQLIIDCMKEVDESHLNTVHNDDVEEVYKAYPTRCPINNAPTGKSRKHKIKIKRVLKKDYTKKELLYIIPKYIRECKKYNVYIKNFSTFLNNIPDYQEPSNKPPVHKWLTPEEEITLDNNQKDKLIYQRKKNARLQGNN